MKGNALRRLAGGTYEAAVPGLGPLETAVMCVLWDARGPLTAREVMNLIDTGQAYTTIMTVLDALHRKKGLTARGKTRHKNYYQWRYSAAVSLDEYMTRYLTLQVRAFHRWTGDLDAVLAAVCNAAREVNSGEKGNNHDRLAQVGSLRQRE